MRDTLSSARPDVAGLVALLCPVAAIGGMLAYQGVAHRAFWQDITPGENFAGAMMVVGELGRVGLAAALGAVLGLACALISMRRRRVSTALGRLGLALNGVVLVLLGALCVRIMMLGR